MLGDDAALVGINLPIPSNALLYRQDLGLTVNFCAVFSRSGRHCLGDIGRCNMTIIRMMKRPDDAVCVHKRPEFFHPGGRNNLEGHTAGVGGIAIGFVLIHAVLA